LGQIDLSYHCKDPASENPVGRYSLSKLGQLNGNLRCKFQFSQGFLEVQEIQLQGFTWRSRFWLQRLSTKEKNKMDCLVKEQGYKGGADIMITGVPCQKGAEVEVLTLEEDVTID
ncbi:hypothetical protein Tco_0693972, partial [Tanacetum coccineum]